MPIFAGFLQQCATSAEQEALIQNERRLSYAELKTQAEKITAFLLTRPTPPLRIAVALERGIDAAIAIYGISFAGGCYVPLDIKNPVQRLRFISEDADVQYIIGAGDCPEWVTEPGKWQDINRLLQISALPKAAIAIAPQRLAAILYTSGSTGNPKGVALSHEAMLNFAQWAAATFNINASDRIASLAPFYFDLSIFDLFTTLSSGAAVHFVPAPLTLSPSRLTAWLQANKISVLYTVPSLLSFLAWKGALHSTPLPDLRTILFAGEVFPIQQLQQLCALLPDADLYNLYGPTETNVCCYWPVDRSRLSMEQSIPIGGPACGSKLRIAEESGELWVKSANNFSGYWQQGRLIDAKSADGWFATGDRVSINRRGEYCYHGRLDRMIKCSGYRVEPAEIETVINRLPGVADCAVIGIADATSGLRPAATVVLSAGCQLADIAKSLRNQLPAYMQPGKIIVLPALPRLHNGKTDYHAIALLMKNSACHNDAG